VSTNAPPQSPEKFNPDSGVTPPPTKLFSDEQLKLRLNVSTNAPPGARPPAVFNPDPGASLRPALPPPVFDINFGLQPTYGTEPIEEGLQLPRGAGKTKAT